MNKFLFKSSDPDLPKIITLNKLDILMKNVLYATHQLDKILVIVKDLDTKSNLQKQVDEYFDEDKEDIPEVEKE